MNSVEAGLPVSGVRLGTAAAGIRYQGRDDLVLMELAEGSLVAGVFTRNAFCAAPVTVARENLSRQPRWLLVNSGNANAGTGKEGMKAALASCDAVSAVSGGQASRVLPFSTGVIGEHLPVSRIQAAMPAVFANLDEQGWQQAARAIMTTDTRVKLVSRQLSVGGEAITVTGMAKGSGMIHPNMATMLGFIATDARIQNQQLLQQILDSAVENSFNSITVDGDTSTNDACMLVASGRSAAPEIREGSSELEALSEVVSSVCAELAEAIVRDGEGATKLIRIRVAGARDRDEAHRVANTIALSPLVKTALFASDPNWGRILAAVGRAGIEDLAIDRVAIFLGDVCIVANGERSESYTEEAGQAVMSRDEIVITVELGRGNAEKIVLTCDLSYDYVRINAEYRS